MPVQTHYIIRAKEIREKRRARIVDVAAAARLSAGGLSQLENGKGRAPRIDTLDRIAHSLKVPFCQLVTFPCCTCACHVQGQREVPHAGTRYDPAS